MQPAKIEIKNDILIISWSNREESEIELREIRKNCPCAYCSQYRQNHQDSLLQVFLEDQIKIKEIKTIGNYALGIEWQDGHHTGIFEFNKLKKLAI
jgi:DUF971 family protein